MRYRYIGDSQVSFEYGRLYEAQKDHDEQLGECYLVKDESGEWYCYTVSFFEKNFRTEEIKKEAV